MAGHNELAKTQREILQWVGSQADFKVSFLLGAAFAEAMIHPEKTYLEIWQCIYERYNKAKSGRAPLSHVLRSSVKVTRQSDIKTNSASRD